MSESRQRERTLYLATLIAVLVVGSFLRLPSSAFVSGMPLHSINSFIPIPNSVALVSMKVFIANTSTAFPKSGSADTRILSISISRSKESYPAPSFRRCAFSSSSPPISGRLVWNGGARCAPRRLGLLRYPDLVPVGDVRLAAQRTDLGPCGRRLDRILPYATSHVATCAR